MRARWLFDANHFFASKILRRSKFKFVLNMLKTKNVFWWKRKQSWRFFVSARWSAIRISEKREQARRKNVFVIFPLANNRKYAASPVFKGFQRFVIICGMLYFLQINSEILKFMKKRPQTKKYPPSAVKNRACSWTAKIGKVKRIGFYISDKTAPNGKQRKVIALNTFYLDVLRHIGVKNVSEC